MKKLKMFEQMKKNTAIAKVKTNDHFYETLNY